MNTLIRNGRIADDGWQWIDESEAQLAARLKAGGRFVLPLAAWLTHRASLDPACAGVWLGPDDEPEALLPWLADTIVQLIVTLKGGGNGAYNRPDRDHRPRSPRPADDERTGAIRDE